MQSWERRCPNGHAVRSDVVFCPQCGTPVASTASAPTCLFGHPVAPGASFCAQCGAGVGPADPAAAMASSQQWSAPISSYPPPPPQGYVAPTSVPSAPQYVPFAHQPTSGLAIASLVVSLVWVYWVNSVVALVLGIVALHQIKERHERGRGMAIAAIVISATSLGIGLIFVIFVIVAVSSSNSTTVNTALRHVVASRSR